MIKKHKVLYFLLALAPVTLILSGCLKEYNSTIALPEIGTAANVIPDEIRTEFESKMSIYEGVNPPDITSSFTLAQYICDYSSDGYKPSNLADRFMAFYNRKGNVYEYSGAQGDGTQYSSHVVVIGSGADFTAYFISDSEHEDGTWAKRADLFSGTMTDQGIKNPMYAFIILDKYDPENVIMDVNEYRIFSDKDGMAEFVDWMDADVKSYAEFDESLESEDVKAK